MHVVTKKICIFLCTTAIRDGIRKIRLKLSHNSIVLISLIKQCPFTCFGKALINEINYQTPTFSLLYFAIMPHLYRLQHYCLVNILFYIY